MLNVRSAKQYMIRKLTIALIAVQRWLSHRKVTTSATLANITQAESVTGVAVVIYARDIRIGKVRDKGWQQYVRHAGIIAIQKVRTSRQL